LADYSFGGRKTRYRLKVPDLLMDLVD